MTETQMMGLGLLEAAQAQKHVTVNEALLRLDALASRQVLSAALNAPPAGAIEGDRFVVAEEASGDWAGQEGRIAFHVNGGWEFHAPWAGYRAFDAATRGWLVHDGVAWQRDVVALSAGGASTRARIVEIDHDVAPGASSVTVPVIPDKAVVYGVTGRVLDGIGGAASWSLGAEGGPDRYGSGIGTSAGSFVHGVTGAPLAYFGATPLVLTAEGGSFTGGRVRLAVHLVELTPPG